MKILIVQTGFIGDVILSTPVFYNLKKIYPQAKITLLTTKEAFPLMKMQESLDTVKVFDKRQTKKGLKGIQEMAKELANENFDAVFSLHKSFRTALLLKLSKIPHRYGFKESKLNFLYTGVSARDYTHEALRNLAILKNINVNIEKISQDLQLNFDEETRVEVEKLLAEVSTEKLIGIAPGSVWATKRWTTAGFSEAAQHFSDKGFRVVLLGGPSDE
ncbi:MAG: glycosyltransferase family 9 protein, partial [Proteobacteria bacterium]|nr:glycosyltransferase family 9 protein [Pseudomonadota bacterium]